MKNLMRELIYGRGAKASMFFVFGILMFIGLGCFGSGKSSSSATVPPAYFGDWKGSDGSTISIRGDGKGDYKSGGTSVDGGSVEIDDAKKELSITFFGIGPSLKIDSPPSGDEMKLGGVIYKRSGGSTTADTKKTVVDTTKTSESPAKKTITEKADAKKGEIPSDEELQEIVKESLLDFNDAVKEGDFTDFHGKISKTWQKQTTPEAFNTAFSEFITRKLDISDIGSMEADFSPAASIDKSQGVKVLLVNGKYDTSPNPTRFDMKYIADGSIWKLLAIRVDTRKQ